MTKLINIRYNIFIFFFWNLIFFFPTNAIATSICDLLTVGDCNESQRCDETYSLSDNNFCYPYDAVMDEYGTCNCPPGGCNSCLTGQIDTSEFDYCTYPLNVFSDIIPRLNQVSKTINIQTKISYEREGYPESCGNNKKRSFSYLDCFAAKGDPITCGTLSGKEDGFNNTQHRNAISFGNFQRSGRDKTGVYSNILQYSKANPFLVNPNDFYAVQTRIEKVEINNVYKYIIRSYFTSGNKMGAAHNVSNPSSNNSDDNYFVFQDFDFSNAQTNSLINGSYWLPMEHCGCINDCDETKFVLTDKLDPNNKEGVDCYNTKYIASLLVDKQDSSKGIIIPVPYTNRFTPDLKTGSGDSVFIPNIPPPNLSWSLKPNSTFLTPKVTVTMTDPQDNSTTSIDISETKKIYYQTHKNYNYQFFLSVENFESLHDEPQVCVYGCQTSDGSCLVDYYVQRATANLNIKNYLTTGTADQISAAKDFMSITNTQQKKCVNLPYVENSQTVQAIDVTARAISSTYEEPKIKVTMTDGTNISAKVINLAKKDAIESFLSSQINNELTIKDSSNNPLYNVLAINLKQEKDLNLLDQNINFCRYYNFSDTDSTIGYDDNCTKHIDISSDNDTFLCVHNLFPEPMKEGNSNIKTRDIPYLINSDLIKNDYKENYDNTFNKNLCVPAPKKFNHFTYEITSDSSPIIANITINYNEPKPFNDSDANYLTDGALKEITFVENFSSDTNEVVKELDYFHKFKFTSSNNGVLYCVYYSLYDYSINGWTTPQKIGDCTNIATCAAHSDSGYNFPKSYPQGSAITVTSSNDIDCKSATKVCNSNGNWGGINISYSKCNVKSNCYTTGWQAKWAAWPGNDYIDCGGNPYYDAYVPTEFHVKPGSNNETYTESYRLRCCLRYTGSDWNDTGWLKAENFDKDYDSYCSAGRLARRIHATHNGGENRIDQESHLVACTPFVTTNSVSYTTKIMTPHYPGTAEHKCPSGKSITGISTIHGNWEGKTYNRFFKLRCQ